jgi:hypothetical protein
MMPTGFSVGAPTSYFGQTFPSIAAFGGSPFAAYPFGLQAQQQTQPAQQLLQQLLQIVPQQLQQLLHVIPQQLQQVQHIQHHQLQYLQQLLQIVPQQLFQLQQLVHSLPQQLIPQPFGAYQPHVPQFGLSPQAPWGFSAAGQGTPAIAPHAFGFGTQPGQVM